MNKDELISKIKYLSPWYQNINLNGVRTINKGDKYISANAGEKTWNTIKTLLPDSLENMRILDLGCNAGYYSLNASLLNAKEVIGVELTPTFYAQALFVKDYYEELYNRSFNVQYLNINISDLDFDKIGKFDYVFAIAVLYHIGKHQFGKHTDEAFQEQINVIKKLSKISDKFIVRCRNSKRNSREYYKKIFKEANFIESQYIPEGKRGMILYESMG